MFEADWKTEIISETVIGAVKENINSRTTTLVEAKCDVCPDSKDGTIQLGSIKPSEISGVSGMDIERTSTVGMEIEAVTFVEEDSVRVDEGALDGSTRDVTSDIPSSDHPTIECHG